MMATKVYDYLIIGNSAGGIGCVEGIRKVDLKGSIALVSDEPHHTYSRPMITHLIEGLVNHEEMDFRPRGYYEGHGVEAYLGYSAEKPDIGERSLNLVPTNGGRKSTVKFRKMLIAAGGIPFMPPIDGEDLDGITPMTTLNQSVEVSRRLSRLKNVVVLGAGLIGMKTAESLSHKVKNVTVVELADRILAPVTDHVSSAMTVDSFRQNGVEVLLNNTIVEARGDARGHVVEVVLKNGKKLPCDLLVIAAGVRPRTELVTGTDIRLASTKIGGGIEVDLRMRTGVEGVYACGDCAHAHDFITGGMRLLPLWPNAYIGGRIAGLNMAGSEYTHTWATNMNAVDFFGLPMVSAGFMIKPEKKGFQEIIRQEKESYAKIILKDDVIQGLIMAGRVDYAGIYLGLMRERIVTTTFKEELLKDDLALLRLPSEIRESLKQPIRDIG
jgi:NADPH-dependent 2,4-dienoyl-CoA reductase/sulfur reductase-like enzyme